MLQLGNRLLILALELTILFYFFQKLMATNSDEGRNAYNEFIAKACRHITHILEDLPTCKPAIDHLLELLPRLQPRFYSISSSSKVHKDFVHVTAVVIGKLFHPTIWNFNTFSTLQFLREINFS